MGLLKKLFGSEGRDEGQGELRHAQLVEFDNCTELIAAVGEASYQPRMSESPWNFDGDPHGLTITP